MTTRALAIADHVASLLAGIPDVPVFRDIVREIDRTVQLALMVEHGDEPPPQRDTVATYERAIDIHVTCVAKGSAPYSRTDAPISAAHDLIMQDRTLGGLAMDIEEGPTTRQRDPLERDVGIVTKTYRVVYRTGADSLE